jgi:hypothetical protein
MIGSMHALAFRSSVAPALPAKPVTRKTTG